MFSVDGSAVLRITLLLVGSFCSPQWIVLDARAASSVDIAAKPRAGSCAPSVTSGFSGDLNASYGDGYGGDGGGGGGGGDSGGGAGAGAGEGKVLGGLMTITRLSDGAILGTAVTDNVKGLVTIKPCTGDLPFLLTLTGQAGARYFDEGTNQLTAFGMGNVLHALVDTLDENVGVSPLTEAGYRYALNNFILNPQDIRAGRVALASTGSVTGLSLAQVKAANSVVLSEINRAQPTGLNLATIKSLPTPIDSASPSTALPNNRYGVAAAVLGGLATMGKEYTSSTSNPGLVTGEQFARDLTDGKLDGFGLDGLPASGTSASLSYDAVRFPIAINVGANAVSARFGATTTFARSTTVAELTDMAVLNGLGLCAPGSESTALLKDGSITVTRTNCGGTASTLNNFATHVRLVEGSGLGELPRTFFVKEDGTVWAWGETVCGVLGTGEASASYRADPVQLSGIKDVTSIGVGSYFALARDSTGAVYSWGINYEGELGLGTPPPNATVCQNDFINSAFRLEASLFTPTRITGLANVVTVTADHVTAYALDRAGSLFQWGLIPTGYDFTKPQPYFGEFDIQSVPKKVTGLLQTVAIAVSYYMKMALSVDGTLWGFGPNTDGNFGDGTLLPRLTPTQVPGLSRVAEIGASGNSPFVALLQDGTIRYWGGCCAGANQSVPSYVLKVPTAPVAGSTPFYSFAKGTFSGTLPKIRHVKGSGGKVLLYGVDGSLFQFPKSDAEQVFVVVAEADASNAATASYQGLWWNPAGAEAGWGLNLAHQGDVIFATWFTYDTSGKAWWLTMTANKIADGVYSGTLYRTNGAPFSAFVPPATATPAGTGTLTFTSATSGTFAYQVSDGANVATQTKAIVPQVFGTAPSCVWGAQSNLSLATNFQDLWWTTGGVESGWGINLTHQGTTIFATWFTYDANHNPLWYSVTAPQTGPNTYSGALLRTNGPAFSAVPFNPALVGRTTVGSATFTFTNGNAGSFAYTVNDGANVAAQTKSIVRQVFRAPGTVCQ